ncbi:type II secretion system major pseudopilin GspG [Parachitinimonas caeni]|uniref:Type II secretion system core protein G n=1 Tax=Parachitinimonas caeni TaxID=3031301 RepID=A0ABT7DSW7_9NEIS|nr:type II secretion system major pseudopilin GspG [Parachitinimonas caeni]MDK2122874.1 type II secretion system major pseudopilin GspG [Parachitinimonas caeni]
MLRNKKSLPSKASGFTLIELLIVMVILGLLAALVGPRLFGHVDSAKINSTKTQLGLFATALDAYRLDFGKYPTTEEGLSMLVNKPADDVPGASKWRGPYLKNSGVLPKDGWGNDFQYKAPGDHGDYDLFSFGSDGKEGGDGDAAEIGNWTEAGKDANTAAKP